LKKSPVLEEAKLLSENLAKIASAGLEAIAFIHQRDVADNDWVQQKMSITEKAKEQSGRCDLQVIKPIQKLIRAAGGNEETRADTSDILTYVVRN